MILRHVVGRLDDDGHFSFDFCFLGRPADRFARQELPLRADKGHVPVLWVWLQWFWLIEAGFEGLPQVIRKLLRVTGEVGSEDLVKLPELGALETVVLFEEDDVLEHIVHCPAVDLVDDCLAGGAVVTLNEFAGT